MEKKLRNTTLLTVAVIIIALSTAVTIITTINFKTAAKNYQKNIKIAYSTMKKREEMIQKTVDTSYSEMLRQGRLALKRGFKWGVKALGARVTSEGFDESLENLENIPEEDIIEFRFKDGKIGRIKHWKTKGE